MDVSREILQFLHYHPLSSRDEISQGTAFEGSDATMKRLIASGIQEGDIVAEGKARATRYRLSDQAHLLMPLNLDTYFALDVDERQVQTSFNFDLIRKQLPAVTLFSAGTHPRHYVVYRDVNKVLGSTIRGLLLYLGTPQLLLLCGGKINSY